MRVLCNSNVFVRAGGLWLLGYLFMYAMWVTSYVCLPERVAEGKFIICYMPVKTESTLTTFLRIFLYNVGIVGLSVAVANLFRICGFPLGQILSLYHWSLYGIFLGTNSFSAPSPSRLAPNVFLVFSGSGIYELTAYTLIAAATSMIWLWRFPSGLIGEMRTAGDVKLTAQESIALTFSLLLLALANYLEAFGIST